MKAAIIIRNILLTGAGVVLVYFGLRFAYEGWIDPPEDITMQELALQGDNIDRIRITNPAYHVMERETFKHWDIVPLQSQNGVQLIYICQDFRFYEAYEAGDSSLHPANLPKVIVAENPDLTVVPGNLHDELLAYVNTHFPGPKVVFEEMPEQWTWMSLILAPAGILLLLSGVRNVISAFKGRSIE